MDSPLDRHAAPRRARRGTGAGGTGASLLGTLLFALLSLSCSQNSRTFETIVLVTIDTLRADHLGCYGYPRPTSPFIDSLAAEGVVFDRAIATSSHTSPSHASIMTSLYPLEHGVLRNGEALPEGRRTLASLLGEAGFETAAFTSVRFLRGVAADFDHVDTPEKALRPGSRTVDAAVRWLRHREGSAPLFLWLHLYDVHQHSPRHPPPKEYLARIRQRPLSDPVIRRRIARRHGIRLRPDTFLAATLDRYDARIAYVDAQLERLYRHDVYRRTGRPALWIVTSDHGEGLGTHQYIGHGRQVYQEQVRVPLVFHPSDGRWPSGVVPELVRLVDLLPTILDAATGHPSLVDSEIEGISLLGALRKRDGPEHLVALSQRRPADPTRREKGWDGGRILALQSSKYKYILKENQPDEFYDLETDPLERRNLVASDLPEEQRLRDSLRQRLSESEASDEPESQIDPDLIEDLRALGYLGGDG